jgi:uncharacterized membrane protein YqjE
MITLLLIAIVILLIVLVNRHPLTDEQKRLNRSFARFVELPLLAVILLAWAMS